MHLYQRSRMSLSAGNGSYPYKSRGAMREKEKRKARRRKTASSDITQYKIIKKCHFFGTENENGFRKFLREDTCTTWSAQKIKKANYPKLLE